MVHVTRNWGKTFVKWPVAVDENNGPNRGGCDTCRGLVTIHTILAVDLIDVKKKEMVWRGQATVDMISNTQKGDEKQVQKSLEPREDIQTIPPAKREVADKL